MPRAVIQDGEYDTVEQVMPQILSRFPIDWNGKRVLVKPNMLGHFNYNENSGSTTISGAIKNCLGFALAGEALPHRQDPRLGQHRQPGCGDVPQDGHFPATGSVS